MRILHKFYISILTPLLLTFALLVFLQWQESRASIQFFIEKSNSANVEFIQVLGNNPLLTEYLKKLQTKNQGIATTEEKVLELFRQVGNIASEGRQLVEHIILFDESGKPLITENVQISHLPDQHGVDRAYEKQHWC